MIGDRRSKPRIFDENGREIFPTGDGWTVPDGARVVSSVTLMDSVRNGDNTMNTNTVKIGDKVMTMDAAVEFLQRRVHGLEGQLAAMDAMQQAAQPPRDPLKERADAAAQAMHARYLAEIRERQGPPVTPQQEYTRRLQNAWKTSSPPA